jgi:acrylyl-CoA reductase (NADPH)
MANTSFPCYMVRKSDDGKVSAGVESITVDDLPPGDVLLRTAFSSLNYKDALAATGHPGVVARFPHVPGIDVAGTVEASTVSHIRVGDQVIVTGYELGAGAWGGYSQLVRVPADWIVPLPQGLTLQESMVYGTAGFTAAQAVAAIQARGIAPDRGDVVVTGASGGVGSLAVALLAKLGYQVVAVTGKSSMHDRLKQLGAAKILPRKKVRSDLSRPLLVARWAAAVDTVGGEILSTLLRSTKHRGCVAACGMVAGIEVPMTVYPFILRGVDLAGIDSAKCPMDQRRRIWDHLAGDWKIDDLASCAETIELEQLGPRVEAILAGKAAGRVVVAPQ